MSKSALKSPSSIAAVKKDGKRLFKEGKHLLAKNKKKIPEASQESVQKGLDRLRQALEKRKPGDELSNAISAMEQTLEKELGFARKSSLREFVDSIVVAVLIAGFLRAFVLEAFKIPSGSMIPSLKVGDHLFVNKFIYGLRVPFPTSNSWIVRWGSPERGDVIVFRYPLDQSKDFIKRVVALSGDRVRVEGDQVYVNGKSLKRTPSESFEYIEDREPGAGSVSGFVNHAFAYTEKSFGEPGEDYSVIYDRSGRRRKALPDAGPTLPGLECADGGACIVKEGFVFAMGDNRDNSSDGRFWGGVPKTFIKGKAMFLFWSRGAKSGIRWDRIGAAVR
jgi:signal peptidase I